MKTIAFIDTLLCALLICAAGCSRSSSLDFSEEEEPGGLHSIIWLKSLCKGESWLVTEEIVIRGRIIANDRYGEWNRALVVADETGGIEVFAEGSTLADRYPFGATVTLYCNGLRLHDYGGKVVLGSEPNAYGFGLSQEELVAHLHRGVDSPAPPESRTVSLDAIGSEYVDTYVRVTGVRFCERGTWCDKDPETGRHIATDRTIVDEAGHTFIVRTAGGCDYAKEPLPSGKGSLCGIIDYFNGRYSLRVVNREFDFSE